MKNLYCVYLLLAASLLFALTACNNEVIAQVQPTATPTITPIPSATSTWTPTPSATPTWTPTPTITPTPGPLSSAEVFALVSPSVAFIETERGSGSGVLIADGYLVTNAHVTWPFSTVRVVFPDGSEFADAPVVNIDPLADLALIGPLDTDIAPVALVDGESQAVGSDVYLIGYPGEPEKSPQPTLTRGLISRTREWDALGITYFQTDALITGGQSGGAFVSDYGNVIGISGLSFSDAEFGLIASAADLLPRIEDLVNTSDSDTWIMPVKGGKRGYDDVLLSSWDTKVYVIQEQMGAEIDIEVESDEDVSFEVVDMYGSSQLWVDERFSGKGTGQFTVETPGPYFLVVKQRSQEPINFHIEGSRALIPFPDTDDHTLVQPNETVAGYLDYPGDSDQFRINLDQGERVNIRVDTTLFDPVLVVDFLDAGDEQRVMDDDSGNGVFGLSAELTYEAPHNGVYTIIVKDAYNTATGGYMLQVEHYARGVHPTPMAPAPTRIPVMITLADLPSEFEEMKSQDLKKLMKEMPFAADSPFGFENRNKFQLLIGFTTSLSDPANSAPFDFLLDHPELAGEMFSNFTDGDSSGADVEAVAITDLGDQAIQITMVYRMEGMSIRYEIIMFRQGDVGAFLLMAYLNGYPPEVQLIELAHLLDSRLLNQ